MLKTKKQEEYNNVHAPDHLYFFMTMWHLAFDLILHKFDFIGPEQFSK